MAMMIMTKKCNNDNCGEFGTKSYGEGNTNSPILAATLDFTSSFPMTFFAAAKFFYSWAVLN